MSDSPSNPSPNANANTADSNARKTVGEKGETAETPLGGESFPSQGRLAGIDYGEVRVGIAICDPERRIASPLEIYVRRGESHDAARFARLATEERLAGFVVGLPLHSSGEESEMSYRARRFGKWLRETTSLPVVFHDERLTTSLAEDLLREAGLTRQARKKRQDKLAAQMILASYLARVQ